MTIKLKPSDTVFVRKNKPVTFSCNVPIRESWQRTEIVDSVLGKVVSFIRNGTMCLTHGTVLNSYNATCILSTGRFWVELLIASSWYNGQRITCKAQYGIGNTATDLTFEAISTIAISGLILLFRSFYFKGIFCFRWSFRFYTKPLLWMCVL